MKSPVVNRNLAYAASYPVPPEVEPFPPFPVEETRPADEPAAAAVEGQEEPGSDGQTVQATATNAPLRARGRPAPSWKADHSAVSFDADIDSEKATRTAAIPGTASRLPTGGDGTDTGNDIDSTIPRAARLRGSTVVFCQPSQSNAVSPNEPQQSLPSVSVSAQPGQSDIEPKEGNRPPASIVRTETGDGTTGGTMETENSPHLEPRPAVTAVASEVQQRKPLQLYHGYGSPSIWEEAERATKQYIEFRSRKDKETK